MSPTLLGGSASTPATGSSPASASTRSDGAGSGTRRDFDALLTADTGSKPSTRSAAESGKGKQKSADTGQEQAATSSKDPAAQNKSDAPRESGAAGSAESAPARDADTAAEPKAATDPTTTETAPWPPLGLAGLALTGLTPPPVDPKAVAALPDVGATSSQPLSADVLSPQTPPAPAANGPALTAPVAAAGSEASGPIALPLDAEVSDDIALPKALAEAIASRSTDADAPTTPFLHALQTAADLKAGAAPAPFSGSPTATPHVGGDDFDDAMSARIGWLADQKIGHATIKVTPHDLGLIEVRLQMDGDKVHASFTSAHADVRHALESSLPRLREMLNDQGFQLGNADVGHQHTAQDGKAGSGGSDRGGFGGDGEPGMIETTVSPSQLMRQRGLLDAYA
jgi:flagellar hook-length control protein FliK